MRLPPVSLRDLEYVVAVEELGSFSSAAIRCAVSQPSLSAQIRKIEEWAGVRFFERTTRKLFVTDAGRAFIAQAKRVLAEAGQLSATLPPSALAFGGTLRLSAIATFGPYFFPRIISVLKARYPGVGIMLGEGVTEDLIVRLGRGELDAVLVSPPLLGAAFDEAPILREPFMVAGPDLDSGDVAEQVWRRLPHSRRLVLEEGHCLRHQALAMCAGVGHYDRHGTSLETLKYMVAAGEGYTIVPCLAANRFDGVYYSAPASDTFSREIALAWRRSDARADQYRSLAEVLQNFVRQNLPSVQALGHHAGERGHVIGDPV